MQSMTYRLKSYQLRFSELDIAYQCLQDLLLCLFQQSVSIFLVDLFEFFFEYYRFILFLILMLSYIFTFKNVYLDMLLIVML